MGIFTKTYTVQEVHNDLERSQILLYEKIQKILDTSGTREKILGNIQNLQKCGFTNSMNMKVLDEQKQLISVIDLCSAVHNVFSTSAMVVSFVDFEALLKKYKLCCGLLSDYTGTIPENNLIEISEAQTKLDNLYRRKGKSEEFLTSYIKELYRVDSLDHKTTQSVIDSLRVFPFVLSPEFRYRNDYLTIDNKEVSCQISSKSKIFIAAPASEISHTFKLTEKVIVPDPFVFSYTKFGIIIYSKWGLESEDEVLEKYKFLNLLK